MSMVDSSGNVVAEIVPDSKKGMYTIVMFSGVRYFNNTVDGIDCIARANDLHVSGALFS